MAYSSQRHMDAHPGPFLVLVGRVDSLPLKWKREKVSKEKAMPSDAEDVRPKACGEQHSPDRARGAHKRFRGGVGTDSSKGVRCHNPHSHANSALGLILLGTSDILEIFLPCFPKSPRSHYCVFTAVASHLLSAYSFYIGHDFAQRGGLQDKGEKYTPRKSRT